jgi:hypothetical protein
MWTPLLNPKERFYFKGGKRDDLDAICDDGVIFIYGTYPNRISRN